MSGTDLCLSTGQPHTWAADTSSCCHLVCDHFVCDQKLKLRSCTCLCRITSLSVTCADVLVMQQRHVPQHMTVVWWCKDMCTHCRQPRLLPADQFQLKSEIRPAQCPTSWSCFMHGSQCTCSTEVSGRPHARQRAVLAVFLGSSAQDIKLYLIMTCLVMTDSVRLHSAFQSLKTGQKNQIYCLQTDFLLVSCTLLQQWVG